MSYELAVIPGDGIGKEVVDAVEPLLVDVASEHGVSVETTWFNWGSDRYLEEGALMPEDGLETLASFDSILLGAVGHPDVPDHITLRGLRLPITKGFQQHVCKRPSHLYDGVESPLRDYEAGEIDFVVYRQNTEGEYADAGGRVHQGFDHEVAIQNSVFTREGTEPVVRAAFDAAAERQGTVTNVTKSNAQAHGMVFWDTVVEEIADEYPDVTVDRMLVDAASMDLVRRPDQFDVIVASNLFGDILTDIGGIISGSLGLAPSTNIDPTGEYPSMFEPVHGSAFDITGDGIANPIATVLSGALLFEHLGEDSIAKDIERAVAEQLADPNAPRTPDIGGDGTTMSVVSDLGERLCE